jgi:hypothetical protein
MNLGNVEEMRNTIFIVEPNVIKVEQVGVESPTFQENNDYNENKEK